MPSDALARLSIVAGAVAVAAALYLDEGRRDGCEEAMAATFQKARGPGPALTRAVAELKDECSGSEPLSRIAVGLLSLDRTQQAAQLAREAARREPDDYAAWAVLAAVSKANRTAAAKARALNPLASRAGSP
jgi:hypothetical protein